MILGKELRVVSAGKIRIECFVEGFLKKGGAIGPRGVARCGFRRILSLTMERHLSC